MLKFETNINAIKTKIKILKSCKNWMGSLIENEMNRKMWFPRGKEEMGPGKVFSERGNVKKDEIRDEMNASFS